MIFVNDTGQLIQYSNSIDWGAGYGNFSLQAKQSQLIYFLSKLNLSKKICLVNGEINVDKINELDIDLVVINNSDHPGSVYTAGIKKSFIVLDSNFKNPGYHPFHLFFSSFCALSDDVDLYSKREYTASCINRNPRLTRIYLLHKLTVKESYYNNLKLKWFRLSESNGPIPDYNEAVEELGRELYEQFLSYEKNYPEYQPKTEFELCSKIDDFKDSYLNIVMESRCEDIGYLTEKIYKPIRAGQLFLVQGAPGSIQYLRTMGFDVFDDLIDHSYDKEQDWKIRTNMILAELERIYNNVEKYYFETATRRSCNRQRLLSNELILDCLPKL